MTWKAYTVVSGATLLATYMFTAPPTVAPGRPPVRVETAAVPSASEITIQEQADRLAARLRPEAEYRPPSRNPFRFGSSRSPTPVVRAPEPVVAAPMTSPEPPTPPPLPIRLTGVSTSTVDGQPQRTAVLITLEGIVTAREGDMVGPFRIVRVDEEAVELAGADGTSRRLLLRP